MKTIRALVVPVGSPPVVADISNSLSAMQVLCGGGYIQMVPYLNSAVDLVCNEEGKLLGFEPNRPIFGGADVVCGQFFFVRHDEEGECVSLTDKDIEKLMQEFS